MNITDRVISARVKLLLDHPFFGSLAMKLRLVEDPTCQTAYTNGVVLGYSPAFVDKLTDAELLGIVAHEVLHCALHHCARRGSRQPKKWNIATDYAINLLIQDCKLQLPRGALLDQKWIEKSADEIYSQLPDEDEGGNGEGEGEGNDPGGCGECRDAPAGDGSDRPASPAELDQSSADWTIYTAQAAQQAKLAGKLPGSIDRLVGEILHPKADWTELLRRFIEQSIKDGSTWNKGNRRFLAQGIYLPSRKRREDLPPIILAIDTSGSVCQADIDQFAGELTGILEAYETTLHVVYCDTQVYEDKVEVFTRSDLPLQLHPAGGGGTAFDPVFKWAEDQEIDPCCLIYLTDLYGNVSADAPEYPVLWARIGGCGYEPPFGEVISID